jgi:hypothetical protein
VLLSSLGTPRACRKKLTIIGVNQGCILSPTLLDIYIDALQYWLEDIECTRPTLSSIFNILLLYDDDIFLMEMNHYDLGKNIRILKDLYSSMGMTVNTEKTKVMIIKIKKITYDTLIYDNNSLEEISSYKYLGINIHHKLNWKYSVEKKINGGWKSYYC